MSKQPTGTWQERQVPALEIDARLWRRLCLELERRGEHRREAGAFLLGPADDVQAVSTAGSVTEIVYYDDLDAHCLRGGIHLDGSAFPKLWDHCRMHGLRVVADVHTHPGTGVAQSRIDGTNPMIAIPGHIALIIGEFARSPVKPAAVGIHIYRGNHEWSPVAPAQRAAALVLRGTRIDRFLRGLASWVVKIFRSQR
jgi:proteasome lid subunit RPN8/RPN11